MTIHNTDIELLRKERDAAAARGDHGAALATNDSILRLKARNAHFLDAMRALGEQQQPTWKRQLRLARDLYLSAVAETLKAQFEHGEYEDALYDLKNITHDSLGDLIGAVEKVRGQS